MKIGFKKQKPFDLIIPLIKGEGRIMKISYGKRENSELVASKFYKFNLHRTDWLPEFEFAQNEVMSPLDVFDLFSREDFKAKLLSEQKAQALYAYYFETSAAVLNKADPVELDIWKTKSKLILKLIEALPGESNSTETEEEGPKVKLLENFNDLLDALENNNTEYFGIQNTATI
jgi:hypothetical protein